MIPQGGIELHARIQQRLVGKLEFLFKIVRAASAVQVVTHGNHKLVGEILPGIGQALAYVVLRFVAGSHITDNGEPNGADFERQFELLLRPASECEQRQQDRANNNAASLRLIVHKNLGNRPGHDVNHERRRDVQKNQIVAHDTIGQSVRQRGQDQKQAWRHRGIGNRVIKLLVYLQRTLLKRWALLDGGPGSVGFGA